MTDDLLALRDRCTRALNGHGVVRAADLLATVPPETEVDTYGAGGVVAELEREVAALLGHEAALYLPSGTMAQQLVLRVHAARRGRRTVLSHPQCHLLTHEGEALERLQLLVGRPVGDRYELLTLADLQAVAEPPAALVLELPQRDLGGQLPSWEDLQAQVAWARDRGAAVHLDGARLWEASAGYERTPAEVAALFDTAYVSFYKGIGALAGCCVTGPADVVAEVREWRQRTGGTLYGMWPGAASALSQLRLRLPRFPAYLAHARAVADVLRDLPGVAVLPDPPQVPVLHLLLSTTAEAFDAQVRALALEGTWTWKASGSTGVPGVRRVELSVGEATMALSPAEVRELVARLVAPLPAASR